jgi:hypothetical protein
MSDCWLEVSLHPEGPATGQLYQGFPWFSLVPEQMLSWYPNSTLHCMLSPCTNVTLGWIALFMGDMGEGALNREDEVTVKQDELTDRLTVAI